MRSDCTALDAADYWRYGVFPAATLGAVKDLIPCPMETDTNYGPT